MAHKFPRSILVLAAQHALLVAATYISRIILLELYWAPAVAAVTQWLALCLAMFLYTACLDSSQRSRPLELLVTLPRMLAPALLISAAPQAWFMLQSSLPHNLFQALWGLQLPGLLLFRHLFLGKKPAKESIRALGIAVMGIVLSSWESMEEEAAEPLDGHGAGATVDAAPEQVEVMYTAGWPTWLTSTSAFTTALLLAGLGAAAMVLWERAVKDGDGTGLHLYERVLQLTLLTAVLDTALLVMDFDTLLQQGLFHDFTLLTWCIVAAGLATPVLVSMALRQTSSIEAQIAAVASTGLADVLCCIILPAIGAQVPAVEACLTIHYLGFGLMAAAVVDAIMFWQTGPPPLPL